MYIGPVHLIGTLEYIGVTLMYVILIPKFPSVMTNQRRDYRKRFDWPEDNLLINGS